jgi:uracil-DNA glycosylase
LVADPKERERLLDAPHVRPLMDLVREFRTRGWIVPNVDPEDGGVGASALFLLESPGPKAVGTQYVSRDNPDPSAKNMSTSLEKAGFLRSDVVIWNVVPYCVSTEEKNYNATVAQIIEAIPDTQLFIDCLKGLKVVIFCGRRAQRAQHHLKIPPTVRQLLTFHTGAMAFNHSRCREDIEAKFMEAFKIISGNTSSGI